MYLVKKLARPGKEGWSFVVEKGGCVTVLSWYEYNPQWIVDAWVAVRRGTESFLTCPGDRGELGFGLWEREMGLFFSFLGWGGTRQGCVCGDESVSSVRLGGA